MPALSVRIFPREMMCFACNIRVRDGGLHVEGIDVDTYFCWNCSRGLKDAIGALEEAAVEKAEYKEVDLASLE